MSGGRLAADAARLMEEFSPAPYDNTAILHYRKTGEPYYTDTTAQNRAEKRRDRQHWREMGLNANGKPYAVRPREAIAARAIERARERLAKRDAQWAAQQALGHDARGVPYADEAARVKEAVAFRRWRWKRVAWLKMREVQHAKGLAHDGKPYDNDLFRRASDKRYGRDPHPSDCICYDCLWGVRGVKPTASTRG